MLLFSDVLNMLVRYASPSGPMCLRCLMLTLSGPVELLFLLCFIAACTCELCCGECYVGCLQFECSHLCVCLVCVFYVITSWTQTLHTTRHKHTRLNTHM